ncbi:PREDICTED: ribosomal L1 domain-containing protein CG13096 [Ceratosolen solmsi marchali]|uniref:Ribosomal L1 domain-containing protein CG13096 n=1 Tax=Ceratosolen solmsi marchali TaxID=326594 RepID=A0AAJ6VJN6_9HYME|nr:PREDICTED: ribosomal L1 domain-containing protein CG13096 [Ceratosolen solmsi marchali]
MNSILPKKKLSNLKQNQLGKRNSKITKQEIINYITILLKLTENDDEKTKSLFDAEKPILLMINCVRIPKVPLHQMRIALPHSLVSSNDDVALFVKDLKKGRRIDYENTVYHFENILQQHGCTQIKTVIPMNQVKTEYRQFEMRRRLLNSYDYFLVDGRISGHMAHLLGKTFREKRKLPTSIHMDKKDLKTEIDVALKKTSLQIHGNGNCSITKIGNGSMDVDKIADNIIAVIKHLKKNFPGGWENIRSLRIKTPLSISIPIYITLKNKNDIEIPTILPKRPKAYKTVEGELSTYNSNVTVIVSPDGTVNIKKE